MKSLACDIKTFCYQVPR